MYTYKKGFCIVSTMIDCLRRELYGSINGVEIYDKAITRKHRTICVTNVFGIRTYDINRFYIMPTNPLLIQYFTWRRKTMFQ